MSGEYFVVKPCQILSAPPPSCVTQFHLLKPTAPESGSHQSPPLQTRLAFSPAIARRLSRTSKDELPKWLQSKLSEQQKPEQSLQITVSQSFSVDQDIPTHVLSDHALDAWLGDMLEKEAGHTHNQVYTVFLIAAEEMTKISQAQGGRRTQERIVMGLRSHGWVTLPDSALESDKNLKKR
jgi:hypothetical protein